MLAELARGRLREKREGLKEAVQGTLSEHHRFLLSSQLHQLDFFDAQLAELDQEVARRLGIAPGPDDHPDPSAGRSRDRQQAKPEHAGTDGAADSSKATESTAALCAESAGPKALLSPAQALRILDEVTGINVRIGEIVVAEIGTVVDRFPSDAHLASWAGLCPQAKISAGKRLSNKTGNGNRWLRQALIEGAQAAARSKATFLGAFYQRLRKRMKHKQAIMALAHRMLVIIYHLLKDQQPYHELGPDLAEEQAHEASKRWAIRRLEQLGYQVSLDTAEVA